MFIVESSKEASYFETISDFILNYVKKIYQRGNDISESLRKLKKKYSLQFSIETENETKKRKLAI